MPHDIFSSYSTKDLSTAGAHQGRGFIDHQPGNPEPARQDFNQAQSLGVGQP